MRRTIFIAPPPPRSHPRAPGRAARASVGAPGSPQMRFDGLPVTADDGPGQLEVVLDHAAHHRNERLRRRARRLEHLRGSLVQRHEIACRHDRARVVERTIGVVERERRETELAGEPEADLMRFVRLRGDRGVRPVELLRPSRARERLQRVDPEPARRADRARPAASPRSCARSRARARSPRRPPRSPGRGRRAARARPRPAKPRSHAHAAWRRQPSRLGPSR